MHLSGLPGPAASRSRKTCRRTLPGFKAGRRCDRIVSLRHRPDPPRYGQPRLTRFSPCRISCLPGPQIGRQFAILGSESFEVLTTCPLLQHAGVGNSERDHELSGASGRKKTVEIPPLEGVAVRGVFYFASRLSNSQPPSGGKPTSQHTGVNPKWSTSPPIAGEITVCSNP